MDKAAKSDAGQSQKVAEPSRTRPTRQPTAALASPLVQLAAMMNASTQARAVAQLESDAGQSARVQTFMNLAAEINQGPPRN